MAACSEGPGHRYPALVPELPEVETVRRSLAPELEGAVITAVEVRHPRLTRRQPRHRDFADRLTGRRIRRVDRHGKFLLTRLEGDLVWVLHLGMSGRVELADPGEADSPHTHVLVTLDSGRQVRMVDPRTFGFVAVLTPAELEAGPLGRLGPDALRHLPTTRELAGLLEGRTAPIKSLLLDQRLLAGLGNIYADEVLHRARIRPQRPGGSLTADDVRLLRASIRPVLEAGLRWGGTSLDDLAYLLPDGRSGGYLQRLRVYGRAGEPCRRCGAAIDRTVIGGRSSYWCPSCQR